MAIAPGFLPKAIGALQETKSSTPPVTSCEEKEKFAEGWVKRFFDNFDKRLDEPTRKEIMHGCGKDCFKKSLGGKEPNPVDVDILIDELNKYSGETAATRDGNVVDFHYVKNERGLKVKDGYCLCPWVESGPEGLSGTYCYCSVGYVKTMFETYTGRKTDVELVESLKRGGRTCRFKITLA